VYFHGEIAEIVSELHAQIVDWWPLPKANPDVFTVAVAQFERDDKKGDMESAIAQDLHDRERSNSTAFCSFHRTLSAGAKSSFASSSWNFCAHLKRCPSRSRGEGFLTAR
jgi:hypothetical protein